MPTKMNFNGQWMDVERVEVERVTEPWVDIVLTNGVVIRERLIVTGVYCIVGQFDLHRNPSYYVASQNVLDITAPEDVKQPIPESKSSVDHPGHFL